MAGYAVFISTEATDLADSARQIGTMTFRAFVWRRQVRCRMVPTGVGNNPACGMFAGCIQDKRVVTAVAASPYTYEHEQNNAASEFLHRLLLSVAGDTALVVGTAMTTVAAGRIEFPLDLVHRHEVAAMGHLAVGTVAVLDGGFHLDLICVAVVAE
jgi:hypothetical protein